MLKVPTPQSSNVEGYFYDPATLELTVTFKGDRTYTYENVDPVTAIEFASAPSKGSFANRTLKGFSFHIGATGVLSAAAGLGELAENALEAVAEHPLAVADNVTQPPDKSAQTPAPAREDRADQSQPPGPWITSVVSAPNG